MAPQAFDNEPVEMCAYRQPQAFGQQQGAVLRKRSATQTLEATAKKSSDYSSKVMRRTGALAARLFYAIPSVALLIGIPVLLMWIVMKYHMTEGTPNIVKMIGLRPMSMHGLWEMFTFHFIHNRWQHFTANIHMWVALNLLTIFLGRRTWVYLILWLLIPGGIMTWIMGAYRPKVVIVGCSEVLFGLLGFNCTAVIFCKKYRLEAVMIMAITLARYYRVFKNAMPGTGRNGWEAHCAGLLAGVLFAYLHFSCQWFAKATQSERPSVMTIFRKSTSCLGSAKGSALRIMSTILL